MIAYIARNLTDFPRNLVTDRVTEFSTDGLTEFYQHTDRILPENSGWQSDRIFDWRTDRILPTHWQNFTKIDWQSDRVTELTGFYHSPSLTRPLFGLPEPDSQNFQKAASNLKFKFDLKLVFHILDFSYFRCPVTEHCWWTMFSSKHSIFNIALFGFLNIILVSYPGEA